MACLTSVECIELLGSAVGSTLEGAFLALLLCVFAVAFSSPPVAEPRYVIVPLRTP